LGCGLMEMANDPRSFFGTVECRDCESRHILVRQVGSTPSFDSTGARVDVPRRPHAIISCYHEAGHAVMAWYHDIKILYIVLSLLAGIRAEEARALRWTHVDLDGDPAARPPVPPHVAVWRSVRLHGETKTERSRRTLGLPAAAVQALRAWSDSQAGERLAAGEAWQDTGLVFTNHLGAALDAGNVRKMFKRVCSEAGIGDGWTPRELRTTFVSLMSHRGVSIEEIARLVGHASTRTTEIVYRRELRPVITTSAEIIDELFTGR
jgi:integrase